VKYFQCTGNNRQEFLHKGRDGKYLRGFYLTNVGLLWNLYIGLTQVMTTSKNCNHSLNRSNRCLLFLEKYSRKHRRWRLPPFFKICRAVSIAISSWISCQDGELNSSVSRNQTALLVDRIKCVCACDPVEASSTDTIQVNRRRSWAFH